MSPDQPQDLDDLAEMSKQERHEYLKETVDADSELSQKFEELMEETTSELKQNVQAIADIGDELRKQEMPELVESVKEEKSSEELEKANFMSAFSTVVLDVLMDKAEDDQDFLGFIGNLMPGEVDMEVATISDEDLQKMQEDDEEPDYIGWLQK